MQHRCSAAVLIAAAGDQTTEPSKLVIRIIPINGRSPKAVVPTLVSTISIHVHHPKSIVQAIPINRQLVKAIFKTIPINSLRDHLSGQFQLIESTRHQLFRQFQLIDCL